MSSDADSTRENRAAPGEPDAPADAPPLAPTGEGGPGRGDAAPAGDGLPAAAYQFPALVGAALLIGLSVRVGQAAFAYEGPVLAALGLSLGAFVLLGGSAALMAVGLLGIPPKSKRGGGPDAIHRQALRLGLPTDPAAYQDGGLAVATTVFQVGEAEVLASVLRAVGIPAWIEGEHTATWYWHLQSAMYPAGIRIMVPTSRVQDAQRALEKGRGGAAEAEEKEPPAEEEELPDPAYELRRSAERPGYLAFLTLLTAPLTFVLALRLLAKIRRERHRSGPSPDLTQGRRIAIIIVLMDCVLAAGVLLGCAVAALCAWY